MPSWARKVDEPHWRKAKEQAGKQGKTCTSGDGSGCAYAMSIFKKMAHYTPRKDTGRKRWKPTGKKTRSGRASMTYVRDRRKNKPEKGSPGYVAKANPRLTIDWSKERFSREDLEIGVAVEHEHAKTVHGDEATMVGIALDHLREDPDYYRKLEKVEKKAMQAFQQTGGGPRGLHPAIGGMLPKFPKRKGRKPKRIRLHQPITAITISH